MNATQSLVAVGRSRFLFDAIQHLILRGYRFSAIITDEAYEEYDVTHADFERLAKEVGASFFMGRSVDTEQLAAIAKKDGVRVAISANWKYTIPAKVLDLFEYGILNFHLGNLPDYKGNATVNWSIINGETHIYGNVHKMAPELDAGDVVARKAIPITPDLYIADILQQAVKDVPELYEEALRSVLTQPDACVVKGTHQGLRCYPRLPEDSRIRWDQSVETVSRLVRASSRPYSGAFSFLNNEKITIWRARPVIPADRFLAVPGHVVALNKANSTVMVACTDGLLEVQEIERDGMVMAPTALVKSVRMRFK